MLELIYKMQPLDYVYLLVGIILFIFAIQSFLDKEHKYRIGTGLFWLLYSVSLYLWFLSIKGNKWLARYRHGCYRLGKTTRQRSLL